MDHRLRTMTVATEITLHEKILLAAFALEEAGQTPFSAEALVVSAWKQYPAAFGLKDFTQQYPDSNKVLVGLMGERGLARRGWLEKLGRKQYALTREGRQTVRRIMHGEARPVERRKTTTVRLSREQEKLLLHLFESSALEKFREGRTKDLVFADACRYWGITENLSARDLDDRLRLFRATLTEIDRLLSHSGEAVIQGGRSVSGDDVSKLYELHTLLEQRFGRHIALLRNRNARSE
jgi:hypothetical protein